MQRFREVEGSLWHVQAELIGWKQKVESLLKTVDGGLGLLMGLDHDLLGVKDVKEVKGKLIGPTSNKGVGLGQGPAIKSEQWRMKSFNGQRHSKSPSGDEAQPKASVVPTFGQSSQSRSSIVG